MKKTIVWILIGVLIMTLALGRASTNNFQEDVKQYIAYGWMEEPEARTWTYVETLTTSSVDVYVVNVNEDVTGLIGPNLKVRLSNPTVKYFGVLAVGAYADGVTPVYLFGGTDYVLDGMETITDVSFSNARAPFGFPLNEDKWAVEFLDNVSSTTTGMADGELVNIGGASLAVPAGLWRLSYQTRAVVLTPTASTTVFAISALLSTNPATTTSDDGNISKSRDHSYIAFPSSTSYGLGNVFSAENIMVEIEADTTYYIKYTIDVSPPTSTATVYVNSTGRYYTRIRAVWGGL